ncbi:hypothetical protein Q0590_22165 [Rhodocytophaga aerolata]|uniref:Uncharacterized protein n=1 Tax=Rhodocytophaga aerolata TaxID=455078 RepID=A0ABT8RA72_9BACT|nr:hypothetical protein [Rhodocytophaga aerolata]MDO1449000.1 hypothetical protein [Rhodocytophaga aerolata]
MDNSQNASAQVRPHEISKTFENALHLYRGDHEKLPELLKDAGALLLRFSRKLSTPQLILAVGIVACGVALVAVNIAKQQEEMDREAGGYTNNNPGNNPNYKANSGNQGSTT